MKIMMFVCAFVCFSPLVFAQAPPTAAEIKEWEDHPRTIASMSCKQLTWLADGDDQLAREFRGKVGAFIGGFILGAIIADGTPAELKAYQDFGLSENVAAAHAVTYCLSHPTHTTFEAIINLNTKIRRRN